MLQVKKQSNELLCISLMYDQGAQKLKNKE